MGISINAKRIKTMYHGTDKVYEDRSAQYMPIMWTAGTGETAIRVNETGKNGKLFGDLQFQKVVADGEMFGKVITNKVVNAPVSSAFLLGSGTGYWQKITIKIVNNGIYAVNFNSSVTAYTQLIIPSNTVSVTIS